VRQINTPKCSFSTVIYTIYAIKLEFSNVWKYLDFETHNIYRHLAAEIKDKTYKP